MNNSTQQKNNYIVYVHVNKINEKKYVGITSRTLEERCKKEGYGYKKQPKFYNAIKKYGWENFEHIILETNLSWEEANNKEKEYIKKYDSYKNGYNCSYGGDGCNGFIWTEDSRKKMVETRIKNGKFKGKNNPCYGLSPKERLSPKMYQIWREKLKNPNIHKGRKVICVNTGDIFDRVGKAGEYFNVRSNVITDSIIRHNSVVIKVNEYHLHYFFDYYYEDKEYKLIDYCYKYKSKSVICLETKEVFVTSNDAGHIMGLYGNSISRVCSHKRKQYNGYHFMYVKEYIDNGLSERNFYNMKKKVICLTTNEIFDSVSEAKRKYPNAATIGISCKKENSYSGKYDNIPLVWQFYEDYLVEPKQIDNIIENNSIYCISLDLYFADFHSAAKYINGKPENIRQCCDGIHKYAYCDEQGKPLLWEYYTHTLNDEIKLIY